METPINMRAAVIGGVNMDICGAPLGRLTLRDSNPGRVTLRPGGVGRNIAHDLRLMGLEVSLIAALGDDMYAAAVSADCARLGLDMSMARVLPGRSSCTYLYVTDETGDMQLGISDMELCAEISPEYIASLIPGLNGFSALVLDANLSPETLCFTAENCSIPLYADPVSTAKACRLEPVLHRLHAIKPNAIEAEALTGLADPERAARALVERGVRQVFISLGSAGMVAADSGSLLRLPALPIETVNTNGAGDAAMAAIVWAGMRGLDLRQTACAALRAGAATAASADSNPRCLAEIFA